MTKFERLKKEQEEAMSKAPPAKTQPPDEIIEFSPPQEEALLGPEFEVIGVDDDADDKPATPDPADVAMAIAVLQDLRRRVGAAIRRAPDDVKLLFLELEIVMRMAKDLKSRIARGLLLQKQLVQGSQGERRATRPTATRSSSKTKGAFPKQKDLDESFFDEPPKTSSTPPPPPKTALQETTDRMLRRSKLTKEMRR